MKPLAPLAAFALVALTTTEARAQQLVTVTTQIQRTEPVFQLPVNVNVTTVTPNFSFGGGTAACPGGCQPNSIEFVTSTLGLVFDAQNRLLTVVALLLMLVAGLLLLQTGAG